MKQVTQRGTRNMHQCTQFSHLGDPALGICVVLKQRFLL